MAFERTVIEDHVFAFLKDNASFVSSSDMSFAIEDAILQVNKDKPFNIAKDITGDGTQDYQLPSEFLRGFSDIDSVETPAGQNPPVFKVREDDWFIYEDPTKSAGQTLRLRFKVTTPATGDIIRVLIRGQHTVTDTASTLDQNSFLGVVYKSLVILFSSLAARFAQTAAPGIAADAVDYVGRSQSFLILAGDYAKKYKEVVGLAGDVRAALAMAEADITLQTGESMVWHDPRMR